jgi:phosphatidylglycerophosphatase A
MTSRPTIRFLVAEPAHLIALGFGSGLPRVAPGTFGTLFGWVVFALVDRFAAWPPAAWLALCAVMLPVGAWAAGRTGAALGVADSGHIVIDEIVAIWVVLALQREPLAAAPLVTALGSFASEALAFGLFRVFDIVKPPPIRQLDARLKNGWGVMLDDLVAAIYTLLVVGLISRLTGAVGAIAIH